MELFLSDQIGDGAGGYIDITSDKFIARVTFWKSGMCDMEALDFNTGDQRFYENTFCETSEKVRGKLEYFLNRISLL
jgi:hypothetical protein